MPWQSDLVIECVANISEGRDRAVLSELEQICSEDVLDVHRDTDHHRSVFTLVGENAVRRLTSRAVDIVDLRRHEGVHPRLGVVDVVPFVPLFDSSMSDALDARQSFAEWAAGALDIPCFLYGDAHGSLISQRTLPDIRKLAWTSLRPDLGPDTPHPRAGAICVGARMPLVAYNIWMKDSSNGDAVRHIAGSMRSAQVRTLALRVGDSFQVSMNLIAPDTIGPEQVHALAVHAVEGTTAQIERCELVGLVPQSVLDRTPRHLWDVLDLAESKTIEFRLRERDIGD